jgi:hypothetical protein
MAAPKGVSVAFGQAALATTPTWTRIDDPAGIHVVTGWQVKRGRTFMTDRTEAGTASADFIDTQGKLDPTHSGGPFYPMNPNCPFAIAVWHPYDLAWYTVYTGLVQQMPQTLDVSEKYITGSIEAADLFSLLAIDELPPGISYGDYNSGTNTTASSAVAVGETTYAAQSVQDRLKAILADSGIPSALTDIFTGNVDVQYTIYPPGTQVLAALQDAADAEFPGVANLYCDKSNKVVFHGREARWDPTGTTAGTDWVYTEWNAGDLADVASHSSHALISALSFDRDVTKVINAALVAPDGIGDGSIAGQLSAATASIATYGNRVYTAENLITQAGQNDGLNANDETKVFGAYYVNNFQDAQTRVSDITFHAHPSASSATWSIVAKVDIGDKVNVTTTHPGGGGFNSQPYYVEGIQYTATPSGSTIVADIVMTLELSPQEYFTQGPFS